MASADTEEEKYNKKIHKRHFICRSIPVSYTHLDVYKRQLYIMSELKDQLSLLGRKTEYKQEYAPEVLEAFENKHPGNDYWVRFNCPEFTSLCPIQKREVLHG